VLQGSQRFHALAALYVVPFLLRLGVFGIAAAAGYRLGAAVLATTASALFGMALAFGLIRTPLAHGSTESRIDLRPFLRYLAPVAVGLVGIALLTHIDLLIVKAHFTGGEAGAAASRDGRGCAESVGRPTVRAVSRAKVPSRPVTG